jgi:hypothetical protein
VVLVAVDAADTEAVGLEFVLCSFQNFFALLAMLLRLLFEEERSSRLSSSVENANFGDCLPFFF